jgi:predicted Zn-dependent protease
MENDMPGRRRAWMMLTLCTLLFAGCTTDVPVTGRRAFTLVGPAQINSMGLRQYADFLKKHNLSQDAEAAAMVKRSGERIRRAVEAYLGQKNQLHLVEGFEWEFNLIEDDSVNAFCMPGGKVAVYTGILPVTKDENGLSVVIAHEIAHAVAQHSRERMSQALLVSLGGLALNRALKEKGGKTRNVFMGLYGAGTSIGYMLPHSRTQEYEADHLGLIFMAMAGYDPRAAMAMKISPRWSAS